VGLSVVLRIMLKPGMSSFISLLYTPTCLHDVVLMQWNMFHSVSDA
jgi:hypothetical protein